MVGVCGQVFNSQTMYKFKIKLLYNEEKKFSTTAQLSNFKITLPLAQLDMVRSKLVLNEHSTIQLNFRFRTSFEQGDP